MLELITKSNENTIILKILNYLHQFLLGAVKCIYNLLEDVILVYLENISWPPKYSDDEDDLNGKMETLLWI